MSTTLTHDHIAIVGAGPAGLSAALFLAKAKIPHTLIDRAIFPRDKVDGNVYGNKIFDIFKSLDPTWVDELLRRTDEVFPCDYTKIFAPNTKNVRINFPQRSGTDTKFFTMNRRHFDQFLVEKLDPTYTKFSQGTEVRGLSREGEGWSLSLKTAEVDKTLACKLVLVADGANSKLTSLLGHHATPSQYCDLVQGYCTGVTGWGDGPNQRNHTEGHFLPGINPGFIFLAPMADGSTNVGIGIPRSRVEAQSLNLEEVFHATIRSYPHLSERFKQIEWVKPLQPWPEKFTSWQPSSFVGDQYMILGDAAGLCNPLTGFGTGHAMISGQLAAAQIQQLAQRDSCNFSAQDLQGYGDALKKEIQGEFKSAMILKRALSLPGVFNSLSAQNWLTHILKNLFRDKLTALKQL